MRGIKTWALVSVIALGTMAACGGGEESSSGAVADVEAAKAIIAGLEGPMTAVGLPKLSAKPEPGKKLVVAGCSTPACGVIIDAAKEAGETVGWDVETVVYDPVPDKILQAWEQVVSLDPDYVATSSNPVSTYEPSAKKLAADGVRIAVNNTDDVVADPVIANVMNPDQIDRTARLTAAWVITEAGDDANVALFNIPDFPILDGWQKAFEKQYKDLCPKCEYNAVALSAGDIGTKAPTAVTSTLQSQAGATHAVFGFGDIATGVAPALRTAGIEGVQIAGISPSLPNLQALIDGDEHMWVGVPLETGAWKTVDALVRDSVGDDTAISTEVDTPFQILTQENVTSPAAQPEVEVYRDLFKSLWNLN